MNSAAGNIHLLMTDLGVRARTASRAMARAGTAEKNRALLALAGILRAQAPRLREANLEDVQAARAAGLEPAFVDRLQLSDKVLEQMAQSCEQVAALPDPIGEMSELRRRPAASRSGACACPWACSA